MRSVQFRTAARAAAWFLLAWVVVDLGNPSLCALDQDGQLVSASAASVDVPSTGNRMPTPSVHVDDCFCCSHCVDVALALGVVPLAFIDSRVPRPADAVPFPTEHLPHPPPRV